MSNSGKYVCGCGLSTTFPFCDGKHDIASGRDGKLRRCGESNQNSAGSAPPPHQPARTPTCVAHNAVESGS